MIEKKIKAPRGIRNNNPLNIRRGSAWRGLKATQTDKEFCEFESMQMGIRAALILMRNHITGFSGSRPRMNTLRKLIGIWAPPTENATERYINQVAKRVGISPTQIIDPSDRKLITGIAYEMAAVECGQYVDESYFRSAWDLIV